MNDLKDSFCFGNIFGRKTITSYGGSNFLLSYLCLLKKDALFQEHTETKSHGDQNLLISCSCFPVTIFFWMLRSYEADEETQDIQCPVSATDGFFTWMKVPLHCTRAFFYPLFAFMYLNKIIWNWQILVERLQTTYLYIFIFLIYNFSPVSVIFSLELILNFLEAR